jgi:hypothetical protein
MRIFALASLLLLSACATAPVIDGPTAVAGHGLDTAVNLYGRYDQRVVMEGRDNYIWRRAVILQGKTYYCELRSQTGFRQTIANSVLSGYPAACSLFSVQYKNVYDRDPAETKKARKMLVAGSMEVSAR